MAEDGNTARGPHSSKPLRQRITDNVLEDGNGCWIWQSTVGGQGYGVITVRVHKLAYELFIGDVPAGQVLDHVECDNKLCCNPAHLAIKTQQQNTARHYEKTEACPQGHPYDEENLYLYIDKQGYPHRMCRTCRREKNHARQLARAKKRGGAGYS